MMKLVRGMYKLIISCVEMSLMYSKFGEIDAKKIEKACSQLQRVGFAGKFSLLGSLIFFFWLLIWPRRMLHGESHR